MVPFLWNKKVDSLINVIRLGAVWCVVIRFSRDDKKCVLLNVIVIEELCVLCIMI